jgi:hypothetical protein
MRHPMVPLQPNKRAAVENRQLFATLGTVASAHTLVSNCNLSCAVVSHGVLFGRGISISGDGLSNLIAIRLSRRGIGKEAQMHRRLES